MPASIFNAGTVKILKDVLQFKSGAKFTHAGTVDPTVNAIAGNPGDLYVHTGSIYRKSDTGSTINWFKVIDANDVSTIVANYIPLSQKAAPNGVATLDGGGKIPSAQLPNSVMELQGFWNANTNTPTLTDGTGNPGDVWEVSVAGTADFGNGPITFAVGDNAVYAADGKYHRSINSNAVTSVNGLTGTVVLSTTNINEGTNLYYTDTRTRNAAVVNTTAGTETNQAPSVSATKSYVATQIVTKANVTLNNLSATAINQTLFPAVNNSINLGGTNQGFANTYTNAIYNSSGTPIMDGSSFYTNFNNRPIAIISEINTIGSPLINAQTHNIDFATLATDGSFARGGTIGFVDPRLPSSDYDNTTLRIESDRSVAIKSKNQSSFFPSAPITISTGSHTGGDTGDINLSTGTVVSSGFFRGKVNILANTMDMNSTKIVNLTDPTASQDAATKNYVDTAVIGAGGANTTLSNLTSPTSINESLLPITDLASVTLGNSANRFIAMSAGTIETTFLHVKAGNGITEVASLGLFGGFSPSGQSALVNYSTSADGNSLIQTTTSDVTNSIATGKILIETGNKTAGIGNSGNIELRTGSIFGGVRGVVSINALNLNMNSSKIVNVLNPTAAQDAATKNYVDTAVTGAVVANASGNYLVRVATTGNIALSALQTIDGIAVVAGDRVLVKNQSSLSQNGIYVVSAGFWTRAADLNSWSKAVGYTAHVSEGTAWDGMTFVSAATVGGVLETTSINWNSSGSTLNYDNTAYGQQALLANTNGNANIAVGPRSLKSNAGGSSNIAIGQQALFLNSSGSYNTAIGNASMLLNVSGSQNTAVGYNSLFSNTGFSNTAVGMYSLYSNTSGGQNTATGMGSLQNNTTGNNNTATGMSSLNVNTIGNNNTASGSQALQNTTTGDHNTATGAQALLANTTGTQNTANGMQALQGNTTGNHNTATGMQTLLSNTSGTQNTANGLFALRFNTTGNNNTATGMNALFSSVAKHESTAVGFYSMFNADNSAVAATSFNTALGAFSLQGSAVQSANTGIRNTALGHSVLMGMTSGSGNVGVGYTAGSLITTGSNNVVIGSNTGSTIATTSNNILISDGAGNIRISTDSTGTVNVNSSKIINVVNPTLAQDAATKNYVDTSITTIASTLVKRDGTNSIQGVLTPDADNTRNLGSTTASFATGYVNILQANDSSNIVNLSTGVMTSAFGFDTVSWQGRKLLSGTVTAASWGNGGLEMYDTTLAVARDIIGVGKVDLVSGANLKNASVSTNRSAVIAAAGNTAITLPSAKGAVIMYRAFRSVGGTETKTGTIHIAKETATSNVNSSINEMSASTNINMDSVVFSLNSVGNLLVTNNTAFSVEVRIVISSIQ